jgi:hypothetical protein
MFNTFLVNKHYIIGHDDRAVHILGLSTRCRWVVSFTTGPNVTPNDEPKVTTEEESEWSPETVSTYTSWRAQILKLFLCIFFFFIGFYTKSLLIC